MAYLRYLQAEALAAASASVLVVTSADSRFLPLLRGMLASVQGLPLRERFDLAVFDLGLTPEDRAWLGEHTNRIVPPRTLFESPPGPMQPWDIAYLARPFLRDLFPGYEVYFWIDADVWFQRAEAFHAYIDGARAKGVAVAQERDRGYPPSPRLFAWAAKHFLLGQGALAAAWLSLLPMLNTGICALRTDAPHWTTWQALIAAAIRRAGRPTPHEQFSMCRLVHGASLLRPGLSATVLPASANWICDREVPMWNDEAAAFCEPYPPYRPLGALHLAGEAKGKAFVIRRTGGGSFTTKLVHSAAAPSR